MEGLPSGRRACRRSDAGNYRRSRGHPGRTNVGGRGLQGEDHREPEDAKEESAQSGRQKSPDMTPGKVLKAKNMVDDLERPNVYEQLAMGANSAEQDDPLALHCPWADRWTAKTKRNGSSPFEQGLHQCEGAKK